jgi:hypothetical protein
MSTTPPGQEPPRTTEPAGTAPAPRRSEPPPPGYGTVVAPRNGTGIAALVLGIVALVLAILIIFFPIAALLGILAIILGAIGMSRAAKGVATNRGQALAGLITGLIALLISIVLFVSVGSFFASNQTSFRRLGTCMTKADNDSQRATCVRKFSNDIKD